MKRLTLLAGLVALTLGCHDDVLTTEPATPTIDAILRQDLAAWGVMPIGSTVDQPPDRVALGRALFFDPVLSGNRDIACATCHQPAAALGDGRSLAVGTGATFAGGQRQPGPGRDFVPRHAPSLLNAGLGAPYLLWDGRISGFGQGHVQTEGLDLPLPSGLDHVLVAQAFLPVVNRSEMRGNSGDTDVFGAPNELGAIPDGSEEQVWRGVVDRLVDIPGYVDLFEAAFPGLSASQVRYEHVARAIAAFERDAFAHTDSPFDRYLARDDGALTGQEKRGASLFLREAGCAGCHNGPFLGSQSFANVGAPQIGPGVQPNAPLDLGRGSLLHNEFYRFAFRVPALRNVELTAPYMHAGSYATLEAVIGHYNDVPEAMRGFDVAQIDPALRTEHHGDESTLGQISETLDGRFRGPLDLDEQEIEDLIAFLEALTDPAARSLGHLAPASVPSGLPVGGAGSGS